MSTNEETEKRIEEVEKRREERKQALALARSEQYLKDLEALDQLEVEHDALAKVSMSRFVPGQPTFAVVRMPTAAEYKRYKDLIFRAAHSKESTKSKDAQEQLARSCWVYPATAEERASMLSAFAGILSPITMAALALAEGKAEEEGKD